MKDYRSLNVWKSGHALTLEIFRQTKTMQTKRNLLVKLRMLAIHAGSPFVGALAFTSELPASDFNCMDPA